MALNLDDLDSLITTLCALKEDIKVTKSIGEPLSDRDQEEFFFKIDEVIEALLEQERILKDEVDPWLRQEAMHASV
ncbi:MAG: hypothetical protein IM337_07470 [Microcystis sp. M110S1]|jgi:hypothetical protein|uniref:hypothetical protein n=1 Tax=Microcystis sp. M110S1 TaxID=2771102 RepID=UPI00258A18AA|nr:hypothetical protein [Microcystis sp. M110S1]MCA2973842.1 hypothetical protein [Microcystis sp. M110S1]